MESQPTHLTQVLPGSALRDCITGWRVFDNPKRSARGRVITTAYLFGLPYDDEVTVMAGDDAGSAAWREIDSLNPAEFFEDHYHIIKDMTYSM